MNYFMLFFRAVFITVFCFGRLPQMDVMKKKKKKMVNFYLFPVYLRQVYIVLVLTSTNQKARNRYPEMVMARTVCGLLHAYGNLKEKSNGLFKMLRIVEKPQNYTLKPKKV